MIVTVRWARVAMDACGVRRACPPDETLRADGKAVWSRRRDRGVQPVQTIAPATVANNAAHRGEHEISRNTIAQGMPVSSGCPVVTTLARFFVLRARLRVRLAPGIPCALLSSRADAMAQPGQIMPRECESVSPLSVEPRHFEPLLISPTPMPIAVSPSFRSAMKLPAALLTLAAIVLAIIAMCVALAARELPVRLFGFAAIALTIAGTWVALKYTNRPHDPIEYYTAWDGYWHPIRLYKRISKEKADAWHAAGSAYMVGEYNEKFQLTRVTKFLRGEVFFQYTYSYHDNGMIKTARVARGWRDRLLQWDKRGKPPPEQHNAL